MDTAAAFEDSVVDYFKDMPDGRQQFKVLYPLDEALLLCLLAGDLRPQPFYRNRAFPRTLALLPVVFERNAGPRAIFWQALM